MTTDKWEINEKSSFCLPISLTDHNDDPLSSISSISWWVGIPKTETIVHPKQEIAVEELSASITVVIPPEANICSGNQNEGRFVAVRVTSGEHTKHSVFPYTIKALDTVPYPSGETE